MVEITETILKREYEQNFVLEITDQRLLQKTGGIVQEIQLAGAPERKAIGAITHVFVNHPEKYGVFAKHGTWN